MGTDDYAPMSAEDPNGPIERLNLPPVDRERVLRGNAARLFRITG